MFGHDDKPKVLRNQGERYESCHLLRTVKYGGGNPIIYSSRFWAGGYYGPLVFMDGNMNQDSYVACLPQQFLPWYYKLPHLEGEEYIFQEDNNAPLAIQAVMRNGGKVAIR